MVDTEWQIRGGASDARMAMYRQTDPDWNDRRFHSDDATGFRKRPLTIETALRDHCHINTRAFFLATVLDDGRVEYFTGSERLSDEDIPKIFKMDQFLRSQERRSVNPIDSSGASSSASPLGLPFAGTRRSSSEMTDVKSEPQSPEGPSSRRRRPGANRQRDSESNRPPHVVRKIALRIGSHQGVSEFYATRFRNIQQTACKLIAKAWIKTLAPKKQSTHPYTGREIPEWWPKPWGPSQFEMVRHREPDHLKKTERVPLLVHILKLVVEPNQNQLPDIQRLNVTVAKLEEVATDALSPFFSDSEKNEAKRPYLKELLKVAKMEEQYKRGEIAENTDIYVMPADRLPGEDDEEDDDDVTPRLQSDSNLSILIHGQSPAASISGPPPPMLTLPAPTTHYGPGSMAVGPVEHSPYMDIDDDMQGPHGHPARRPSMYHSSAAAEYGHHPVPMYPTSTASGPSWHQTTTAPPTGSLFSFAHSPATLPLPPLPQPNPHTQQQPTHSAGGYVTHMDVQLGHSPFLGSSMEGLHPNPGSLFRSGSGSPTHGHGQHGHAAYGRDYGH